VSLGRPVSSTSIPLGLGAFTCTAIDPAHKTRTLPVGEDAAVLVRIGRSSLYRRHGPTQFVPICSSLYRLSPLPFSIIYATLNTSVRLHLLAESWVFRIPLTPALFTRTSSRFCCAVKAPTPDLIVEKSDKLINRNSRRPELFDEAFSILAMALEAFDWERPAI
jgi:hypothetical protein